MKLDRRPLIDPSYQQSEDRAICDHLRQLHTCLPGRIHKYDPVTQRAQIQPVVGDYYWDLKADKLVPDKLPMLVGVPIVFPSAAGSSITFPLTKGDPVIVVFSERSIAEYLRDGNLDNQPSSARAFDLSDAIALPGGRSFNHASEHAAPIPAEGMDEKAMVLRGDEVHVRAVDKAKIEGGGASLELDGAAKLIGTSVEIGDGVIELLGELSSALDGTGALIAALDAFCVTLSTAADPKVTGAAGTLKTALEPVRAAIQLSKTNIDTLI